MTNFFYLGAFSCDFSIVNSVKKQIHIHHKNMVSLQCVSAHVFLNLNSLKMLPHKFDKSIASPSVCKHMAFYTR